MIVVAIISILAAIAIPAVVHMQLKAKRAELPTNVDGIMAAHVAYEASFDEWLGESDPKPAAGNGKTLTPWTAAGLEFRHIEWSPDGDVRGKYIFGADGGGSHSIIDFSGIVGLCVAGRVCASGATDLDLNGQLSNYLYQVNLADGAVVEQGFSHPQRY